MDCIIRRTYDDTGDLWNLLYNQPCKRKPIRKEEFSRRKKARKVAKISRRKNRK